MEYNSVHRYSDTILPFHEVFSVIQRRGADLHPRDIVVRLEHIFPVTEKAGNEGMGREQ